MCRKVNTLAVAFRFTTLPALLQVPVPRRHASPPGEGPSPFCCGASQHGPRDPDPGLPPASGRVLEAVVTGDTLRVSPAELASRLGGDLADPVAGLREMVNAGWLVVEEEDSRLSVRFNDPGD